jgi:hypothetical protein
MDVKVEGQNVDRHLDLTTSNHMSPNGNSLPLPEMESMTLTASQRVCKCDYSRKKCSKTPTTKQTKHVAAKKCWRCGRSPASSGPMIADHQPSLNENWFKGGCNNTDYCKNATSTPGEPPGNKQYNELRARCRVCYTKVYSSIGRKPPGGMKDHTEGAMESRKAASFRAQYKKWGIKLKQC